MNVYCIGFLDNVMLIRIFKKPCYYFGPCITRFYEKGYHALKSILVYQYISFEKVNFNFT